MVAHRSKTADKQDSCKKVLAILKKRYPSPVRALDLPVLEIMLYGICLENLNREAAEKAYERLLKSFHDLNEVRVSSIDEVEVVFHDLPQADWRALRVRTALQHVFESTYTFDFDGLTRKTLELATKQMSKIKSLTPFVRSYTLQQAMGAHLLPIDDRMNAALVWLGVVEADSTPEHTSETLKAAVRKADGLEFCQVLRAFATDSKYQAAFATGAPAEDDETAPGERLDKLLKGHWRDTKKSSSAKRPAAAEHHPESKKTPKKKPVEPPKSAKPKAASKHAPSNGQKSAPKKGKAARSPR